MQKGRGFHLSKCMRVKVEINLLQPLQCGCNSRLSEFCYGGGRLGHSISICCPDDAQDHSFGGVC
jgi:hypothetical protein